MLKTTIVILVIFMLGSVSTQALQCELTQMSKDLEEAYQADQEIRKELMPVIAEYQQTGDGVFKLLLLSKKQKRIDKNNQELLDEWMEKCGWPDGLSDEAHKAVFMILQHGELEDMKLHIDELESKVQKGFLLPDDHATMSDRIAMYEGRAQKFGTQTFQTSNAGNNINTVWPVINQDSLNTWRADVGLPTMEEYFSIARDSMGVEMVIDSTLSLETANRIRGN